MVLAVGIALGALTVAGVLAEADPPTDAPLVLPYDGVLELDGQSVSGTVTLRFSVFDSFAADAVAVWTDVVDVEVVDGRFRTLLGEANPFPTGDAALFREDAVFVSVEVAHPDRDDVWIDLNNRHRIAPSTAAQFSPWARRLSVGGDLTVEGAVQIGGALTAGTPTDDVEVRAFGITTSEDVITNVLSVGEDEAGGPEWSFSMDGDDLVISEADDGDKVHIRIRPSGEIVFSPGGSTQLTLGTDGKATLDGDLSVGGRLTVDGLLEVGSATVAGTAETTMLEVAEGGAVFGGLLTTVGDFGAGLSADFDDVVFKDQVESAGDSAPFQFHLFSWDGDEGGDDGDTTTFDTDINASSWFCWVGGVSFPNGDYQQVGSGLMARAFTYVGPENDWFIRADIRSDGTHEDRDIGVVCVDQHFGHVADSWFSTRSDGYPLD